MSFEPLFRRLAREEKPSKALRARVFARIERQSVSPFLHAVGKQADPRAAQHRAIKQRVLRAISSPSAAILPALKGASVPSSRQAAIWKERMLARLEPLRKPFLDVFLQWTAACAAFVLLIRVLPFVFLPSMTQAGSVVSVLPSGEVHMTVAGITVPLEEGVELSHPALIRTLDGEATVILHDDAVLRLAPHTTIRLHDLTDRPEPTALLTATLLRGELWVLSLLPPTVAPVSIELPEGEQVILTEGSVSLRTEENGVSVVSAFDKRAMVQRGPAVAFLVAGERVRLRADMDVAPFPEADFATPWAEQNLNRDAVHRKEIALLQRERRESSAGILPTSLLYPAKRFAEQVDVLFTVGSEARTQKRIQQAETRFNEALALLGGGRADRASGPILEYRETLLSLATGSGDSLVKFLIMKQIEETTASLSAIEPEDEQYALKEAVYDVIAAVPDTRLQAQDIEGYVLVDRLASLNRYLAAPEDYDDAMRAYEDIQPYIASLLSDESTVHPLLKKEARALLLRASSLLASLTQGEQQDNATIVHLEEEIVKHLPEESEKVAVSEEELHAIVRGIVDRIFLYSMEQSRYNQLVHEMRQLRDHPHRGSILRRLYQALPDNVLASDVRLEMVNLHDELSGQRQR